MNSIPIRELTGARLRQAAERQEVLGVTSDRVLCAVLLPVQQRLVEQLVARNLSEIVHGVMLGEKDVAAGDLGTDVDDILDAPQVAPAMPRLAQRITPVGIRELSAARIVEAAHRKETLGITNNRALVAFLIPISQRWVDHIVQANLSRIVKGIQLGEAQADAGDVYDVDDGVTPDGFSPKSLPLDLAEAELGEPRVVVW